MEALQQMDFGNGLVVDIETDADLSNAPKEPISNQPRTAKSWTEMDKAFLRKHWPSGTDLKTQEKQREVARNLGRTVAACGQQLYQMQKTGTAQISSTSKQRMVAARCDNLTFAEQQDILELFGSFTPEIRAIVLALRGYEKPKIMMFDYEQHKMEVEFFPPSK